MGIFSMHLKSMRSWMLIYLIFTLFDVVVTYIFVSQEQFGIIYESNLLIRNLMEQLGIWQGLSVYVLQEFLMFFVMWGLFYYVMNYLVKGRSEDLHFKVDMLIFNIGVPFIIMGSALLHLFGGIFWIMVGITGQVEIVDPLQLVIYITVFCGLFQAYQVFKLSSKSISTSNELISSEN